MILIDTGIWIEHLRRGEPALARLLEANLVLGHPFVTGEVALGHLRDRAGILALLGNLPAAPMAEPEEVLVFIDRQALAGSGLGLIDIHLLLAARLAAATLWTADRRLAASAEAMGIAHRP